MLSKRGTRNGCSFDLEDLIETIHREWSALKVYSSKINPHKGACLNSRRKSQCSGTKQGKALNCDVLVLHEHVSSLFEEFSKRRSVRNEGVWVWSRNER